MSFVNHEPCGRCGSRNNVARYADGGSWCFGCHKHERPTHAPWKFSVGTDVSVEVQTSPRIPEDAGTAFSQEAVEWLAKFHLDIPTALKYEVLFSPSRHQIIYQMGNVWQARNLRMGMGNSGRPRSKNFTSGDVNECHHIYGSIGGSDSDSPVQLVSSTLVLVEDPVSAIRIASGSSGCDAMPLLGSHLATKRLNAIAGLYRDLVFYLDHDKLKESRLMAEKASLIGCNTRVIYTPLDPKEYTDSDLKEYLK